jgi:hypothetical protein
LRRGFPSDLILVEDGPDFIDRARLGRMLDAARPTYAARHTWRSRLTTLFDLAAV